MPATCPYNFVPLNPKVVKSEFDPKKEDVFWKYNNEKKSGKIKLEIEVESDTFIRGEGPDFLKINDKPILPGSSIRGMVRNLVRVLTWSKIGAEDRKMFFRQVYANKYNQDAKYWYYKDKFVNTDDNGNIISYNMRVGYLRKEKNNYFIKPSLDKKTGLNFFRVNTSKFHKNEFHINRNGEYFSVDYNSNKFDPIKEKRGQKLPYNILKSEAFNKPCDSKGYLISQGSFSGKVHYNYIIPQNESKEIIKVSNSVIEQYKTDINRDIRNIDPVKRVENNKTSICFYLTDDSGKNAIAIGHTSFFRLPYEYSVHQLLPKDHLLKTNDHTDAIFGIASDKNKGFAGRVNFTDAKKINGETGSEIQLDILASPKPTAFKHYLTQNDNNPSNSKTWNDKETRLRGYKFYWQHDRQDINTYTGKLKKSHPDPIKPVKHGAKFQSEIFFTNLSDFELGALLCALQLEGENTRHRIGMGKPYGMGRIKITPALFSKNDIQSKSPFFADDTMPKPWKQNSNDDIDDLVERFKKTMREKTNDEKLKWDKTWENLILMHKLNNSANNDKLKYMEHNEHTDVLPDTKEFGHHFNFDKKPQ